MNQLPTHEDNSTHKLAMYLEGMCPVSVAGEPKMRRTMQSHDRTSRFSCQSQHASVAVYSLLATLKDDVGEPCSRFSFSHIRDNSATKTVLDDLAVCVNGTYQQRQ